MLCGGVSIALPVLITEVDGFPYFQPTARGIVGTLLRAELEGNGNENVWVYGKSQKYRPSAVCPRNVDALHAPNTEVSGLLLICFNLPVILTDSARNS